MDEKRQQILTSYIPHLYTSGRSYDYIGRSIKYVTDFLENADSLNRRGYLAYRQKNVDSMVKDSTMCDAICGFLSFIGVNSRRKKKEVKALEKLDTISEKNRISLNAFIIYLADNKDYSRHTIDIYYHSIKKFFEYANDVSMDNYKRFIKMHEDSGMSPQTICLRITALEKFSEYLKKPIKLNRPKINRKLDISNVPTEEEYNRLLEYLSSKANKDQYFLVKILGTTGARLSEFLQFTWEDIVNGEVTLRGKGNKYRRFFFQKTLQQEVIAYVKLNGRTGAIAVGRFGPLTDRGILSTMKTWSKHCNVDESKLHPHAFRHFFAKMFLKKNKDVIQLADLLGHGSVDTTRIYLQKSYDEQKRDFNKHVTW